MLRRLAATISLFCMAAGCGATSFKSYRLPISAYSARFTHAAIASVAHSQGLDVARFDDAVHVRLDQATWAYYTVQLDEYNLVLQVDDRLVPEDSREAHFESARQRADQIWKQALIQLPFAVQASPDD